MHSESAELDYVPHFFVYGMLTAIYVMAMGIIATDKTLHISQRPHPIFDLLTLTTGGIYLTIKVWETSYWMEWLNGTLVVKRPWGSRFSYGAHELRQIDVVTRNLSILKTIDNRWIPLAAVGSAERKERKHDFEEMLQQAMKRSRRSAVASESSRSQRIETVPRPSHFLPSEPSSPTTHIPADRPQSFINSPWDAVHRALQIVALAVLLNPCVTAINGYTGQWNVPPSGNALRRMALIDLEALLWCSVALYGLGWCGRVTLYRDGIEAVNSRLARQFIPWSVLDSLPVRRIKGRLYTQIVLGQEFGGTLYLVVWGGARKRLISALPGYVKATNPLLQHYLG